MAFRKCALKSLLDLLAELFGRHPQFFGEVLPQLGPPVQQLAADVRVEDRKTHTCMLESLILYFGRYYFEKTNYTNS